MLAHFTLSKKGGKRKIKKAALEKIITLAEKAFVEMSANEKQELIDGLQKREDRPEGFNIETTKDMFDFFKKIRAALGSSSEEEVSYCIKKTLDTFF